jgi:hypothetical protein
MARPRRTDVTSAELVAKVDSLGRGVDHRLRSVRSRTAERQARTPAEESNRPAHSPANSWRRAADNSICSPPKARTRSRIVGNGNRHWGVTRSGSRSKASSCQGDVHLAPSVDVCSRVRPRSAPIADRPTGSSGSRAKLDQAGRGRRERAETGSRQRGLRVLNAVRQRGARPPAPPSTETRFSLRSSLMAYLPMRT